MKQITRIRRILDRLRDDGRGIIVVTDKPNGTMEFERRGMFLTFPSGEAVEALSNHCIGSHASAWGALLRAHEALKHSEVEP